MTTNQTDMKTLVTIYENEITNTYTTNLTVIESCLQAAREWCEEHNSVWTGANIVCCLDDKKEVTSALIQWQQGHLVFSARKLND